MPVTPFQQAAERVAGGADPRAEAAALVAEMTDDERAWCLDGDVPFWAGLTDLGRGGYHRRTFPGARVDEEDLKVDADLARIQLPLSTDGAGPTDALRALDEADLATADFTLRRPSLDDVFLSLTGHAAKEVATTGGRPGNPGARPSASPSSGGPR